MIGVLESNARPVLSRPVVFCGREDWYVRCGRFGKQGNKERKGKGLGNLSLTRMNGNENRGSRRGGREG